MAKGNPARKTSNQDKFLTPDGVLALVEDALAAQDEGDALRMLGGHYSEAKGI